MPPPDFARRPKLKWSLMNELHLPPVRVGLIGAGNIARRYVTGMSRFPELELVAVTDAIPATAEALAGMAGIVAHRALEELLADESIDLVVNITPPSAHADVTIAAVTAGKHVYSEKPIADSVHAASAAITAARERGLVYGVAPDTFLGSAGRTARAAIDEGVIGEPLAASMFITHSKAETWHPDPTFLFQPGGGPLLDMGPYYVTALVNLLGPIEEVTGFTRIGAPVRVVTSPDRKVESIQVNTPTHASASLKTRSGALVTLMASFDVWDAHLPRIEIYGTEGTLSLPDPNEFDGPVQVRAHGTESWETLVPVGPVTGEPGTAVQLLRGIGVRDLARSLRGDPLRVTADVALHVLEVLEAVQQSSDSGRLVRLSSTADRPAAVTD